MSTLIQLTEMPTSGQFVAAYAHEGKVWSFTIRIKNGSLLQYIEDTDEFEDRKLSATWLKSRNPIYLTA